MRRLAAVILAAGRGQRFGRAKQLAPLGGRPLLAHVVESIVEAGTALAARRVALAEVIVVLGFHADEVEAALAAWSGSAVPVRAVRNPDPGRGLSSSIQAGLTVLGPDVEAALVALGDQPMLSVSTVEALVVAWAAARPATAAAPPSIVVPRYAGGGGPNPVLLDRSAWPLAIELAGDTGMRAAIAAHPELVRVVEVPGSNPDVDTPADLEALER